MRSLALGLALAAPLLLAACSLTLGDEDPPRNKCRTAADCLGAAICETELRVCIAPMAQLLRVVLEVTPDEGSTRVAPITHIVGPIDVTGPARRDLLLPPTTDVFGSVRVMGLLDSVQADIRFTEPSSLVGAAPFVAQTNTAAPFDGPDGTPADYAVRVVVDRAYDVLVEPLGEWAHRLPPLRRPGLVVGGVDGVSPRVDFEYPATMYALHGQLVTVAGARLDGLQVRAVDAAGEPISSLAVSGTYADPAGPGLFTLYMPPEVVAPGAPPFRIRITGGVDRPTFPVILVDSSRLALVAPGLAVQVLVPDLAPITYVGTVGTAADASGTSRIAGSTLTFASTDVLDGETGLLGSFRAAATADAAGGFTVELLPGSYEVRVVPPGNRPDLGVLVETVLIDVAPGGTGRIAGKHFELPDSIPLAGSVTTVDMRSVPAATVIASPVPTALAMYNRSARTLTDASGLFNLPVDVGEYDLTVQPPTDSGYAWIVAPNLQVRATSLPTANQRLDVPVPFAGIARGALGPVSGGQIRAFALIGDVASPRAVPIGRADIASDGSYTLLLPSRL